MRLSSPEILENLGCLTDGTVLVRLSFFLVFCGREIRIALVSRQISAWNIPESWKWYKEKRKKRGMHLWFADALVFDM